MLHSLPFAGTRLGTVLQELPPICVDGPWLAGGSIRRVVAKDDRYTDYDIYFRDGAQMSKFMSALVAKGFKQTTSNHFYVTFEREVDGEKCEVQCMNFRFYDKCEDIIDSFDFTICMFSFDGTDVFFGPTAVEDLEKKQLKVHKITYGTSTAQRMVKYYEQGFSVDQETQVKVAEFVVEEQKVVTGLLKWADRQLNGEKDG